jgi:epoxyqueuosine reductase
LTLRERTESVKARAAELGFDACGVASAAPPPDPEGRLGAWLAAGYHAGMAWMAATKDLRLDVRKKLPGAKSVVVMARNYFAPRPDAEEGTGRVSRYAWGRDYHRVLRKPLRELTHHIEGMGEGAACYCCVDSGPMLERAWAARAGLGWIGKNGLVLREGSGSWFFLACIATTVELGPDAPAPERCGSCSACIEACPTEAIVAPRVVDSNRCISYHTIENKGDVPAGLSRHFGDWVFGCDVCQEVCPWNRDAKPTSDPDFLPRPGHAHPKLDTLTAMDEAAFKGKFAGSPIIRAKHAGMARNAAIARANTKNDQE